MKKVNTLKVPGIIALISNLLLLYVAYMATRIAFLLENYSTYEHVLSSPKFWDIFWGGVYFDTSALAYTNALYILLVLLPCHLKENVLWKRISKWFYIIVNGLGLATNLGDAVYFQYTARRTTSAFFSEFGADDKLGLCVIGIWYCSLSP